MLANKLVDALLHWFHSALNFHTARATILVIIIWGDAAVVTRNPFYSLITVSNGPINQILARVFYSPMWITFSKPWAHAEPSPNIGSNLAKIDQFQQDAATQTATKPLTAVNNSNPLIYS